MAAILAATQVGIQAGTQVVTQAGILVDIQIGAEVVVVEIGAIVVCLLTSKIFSASSQKICLSDAVLEFLQLDLILKTDGAI